MRKTQLGSELAGATTHQVTNTLNDTTFSGTLIGAAKTSYKKQPQQQLLISYEPQITDILNLSLILYEMRAQLVQTSV